MDKVRKNSIVVMGLIGVGCIIKYILELVQFGEAASNSGFFLLEGIICISTIVIIINLPVNKQ